MPKKKPTRKELVAIIESRSDLINKCNDFIKTSNIIKRKTIAEREAAISELCTAIKGIDPNEKRRMNSIPGEIFDVKTE